MLPRDDKLTVLDEVAPADLVGRTLLHDAGTGDRWAALRTGPDVVRPPSAPLSTADAVALVAAGSGLVVLPQSVARLHHRKDVTHRPVSELPGTQIGLAWLRDRTTAEVEELVGIVRGRTARSSRTPRVEPAARSETSAPSSPARPRPGSSTPRPGDHRPRRPRRRRPGRG